MSRKNVRFFNFKIFSGGTEEALDLIAERTANESFNHISFITGRKMTKCRFFKKQRKALSNADLLLPEGRGTLWAARRFHTPVAQSFAPVDLMMNLIRQTINKKQTLFFLGSTPDTLSTAIDNLRKNFPNIRILGSHHGYFSKERGDEIIAAIKKFSPNYLFVGLGYPYQDMWIQKNKSHLQGTTCISVGHAIDLSAGIKNRGPLWMRNKGLEGLHKALKNPIRFLRFFYIPLFVFFTFWDKIRKKGKK